MTTRHSGWQFGNSLALRRTGGDAGIEVGDFECLSGIDGGTELR